MRLYQEILIKLLDVLTGLQFLLTYFQRWYVLKEAARFILSRLQLVFKTQQVKIAVAFFPGAMNKVVSCSLWLLLATIVTSSIFTVPVANLAVKQDFNDTVLSSCLDQKQKHSLGNLSLIGTAVYAECFCKQRDFNMCSTWKLAHKTASKSVRVKVMDQILAEHDSMQMSSWTEEDALENRDTKGSCRKYAKNLIDGVYGSFHLNYSSAPRSDLLSAEWKFCEDMRVDDSTGCNYTIVPVRHRNESIPSHVLFHFARSFTNTSQHLLLGNLYQLQVETCDGSVVNTRVSAPYSAYPPPVTPTTEFFLFPIESSEDQRVTSRPPIDHREIEQYSYDNAVSSFHRSLCFSIALPLAALLGVLNLLEPCFYFQISCCF